MEADGRSTRGYVALELIRALRSEAEIEASTTLTEDDRRLIGDGLEPAAWLEQEQCLRLAAAAREHVCERDWSRFHELGAASVAQIIELGYGAVVRVGDTEASFAALSVLWRASFSYGRAVADTDASGATIHVIDCPWVGELEGNVHAGWCLGVARLIEADCASVELRRRPWADEGAEQVVRLHWRGRAAKRVPSEHAAAAARRSARPGSEPRALEPRARTIQKSCVARGQA